MKYGYTSKKQIEQMYDAACKTAQEFNREQKKIAEDMDLSPVGREKKLNQLREQAENRVKGYLNTAADSLKSARERLERSRAAKAKALTANTAYQLALFNAIKAFELRGRTMSEAEIKALAEPFADDPHARATITAAAKAGGADEMRVDCALDSVFKKIETRDKDINGLQTVENFIRKVWTDYRMSCNGMEVQAALEIILENHSAELERAEFDEDTPQWEKNLKKNFEAFGIEL